MSDQRDKVKRFTQLAPVVLNDGVRDICVLYALDASGVAWVRTAEDPWTTVAQPPATTRDTVHEYTRGKASK